MKTLFTALLFTLVSVSLVSAAGSPTVKTSKSEEIRVYNEGVEYMMEKKFSKAEKQFRKALAINDSFAEAHNNLAYTLRKQGKENYAEALKHYNRSIDLNPELDEPYMYRGVLHMQMGHKDLAFVDHKTLASRNSPLASELAYVVENGREKEPEQFFGVSRQIDS
jgi:tetratricopeptide (TPR) repeat protein